MKNLWRGAGLAIDVRGLVRVCFCFCLSSPPSPPWLGISARPGPVKGGGRSAARLRRALDGFRASGQHGILGGMGRSARVHRGWACLCFALLMHYHTRAGHSAGVDAGGGRGPRRPAQRGATKGGRHHRPTAPAERGGRRRHAGGSGGRGPACKAAPPRTGAHLRRTRDGATKLHGACHAVRASSRGGRRAVQWGQRMPEGGGWCARAPACPRPTYRFVDGGAPCATPARQGRVRLAGCGDDRPVAGRRCVPGARDATNVTPPGARPSRWALGGYVLGEASCRGVGF